MQIKFQTSSQSIAIDLPEKGVVGVLGPTGAGKTHWLKNVAGLQSDLHLASRKDKAGKWEKAFIRPWQRNIGYVPQHNFLFHHLTVKENLAFGLKMRGFYAQSNYNQLITEALETWEMSKIAHLRPEKLSLGQQQQVSLLRAFLLKPQLLLLDEPLSAQDHGSRRLCLEKIANFSHKHNALVLFATHNFADILWLGDHCLWIDQGYHFGELNQIFPLLAHSYGWSGEVLTLPIQAWDERKQLSQVYIYGAPIWVRADKGFGSNCFKNLYLKPEVWQPSTTSLWNTIPARIVHIKELQKGQFQYLLQTGCQKWSAISYTNPNELGWGEGAQSFWYLPPDVGDYGDIMQY